MDDATTERWLPLVGFEGFIEISNQGHIRSLDRITTVHSVRYGVHQRVHKGKILKLSPVPAGYLYITLAGGGKIRRNAKVHHLVLETFVRPRPPGMEGCHANDIPDDNRLVNLRWDTTKANAADVVANGKRRLAECGEGHKFTPENCLPIRGALGARRCRQCHNRACREGSARRRQKAKSG